MIDNYTIVRYTSTDCPEEVLKATAAFYMFIFNNASDHFFIHRDTGISLGRDDILELNAHKEHYIANSVLKQLYDKIYRNKGYALWHQEETVFKNIKRKLKKNGLLVLMLDTQQNDQIKGFSFGRRCILSEALKTEEWINPYIYSELHTTRCFNRKNSEFLDQINEFLLNVEPNTYKYNQVTLDTPVYCWNAAGLAPELQGKGYMKALNTMYFSNIPKEYHNLLLLGEASDKEDVLAPGKKPTNLENFERVGARKIMKMDDDLYLIGVPVKKFIDGFMSTTTNT